MKKMIFILPLSIMLGMGVYGCNNSDSDDGNEDVGRLYSETCRLTKVYTDSIAHANDSTSVMELMKRYDDRLTNLNFSVRAETDYHLSEGMNDTISMLVDSLRRVYDSRLYRIAHPLVENGDSISRDSLSSIPPSRTAHN
ncbi:MAG: hypothetical protein K2M31_02210 [Muribaculaceae bacterium]|nr:hypothetical protein [Muribaculaceae bacterium]